MSRAWLLIVLAAACLTGCGDDDSSDDGPSMAGVGGDDGVDDCPDPNNPGVHYRTRDVGQCPAEDLVCDSDQYGFHNACGCGCIDEGTVLCNLDPTTVDFISQDPAECGDINPDCPLGQRPFNSMYCGCGCGDES